MNNNFSPKKKFNRSYIDYDKFICIEEILPDMDDNMIHDILKTYISSGYRSILYVTNPKTKQGEILFNGYDLNNNPCSFRIPWSCRLFFRTDIPEKNSSASSMTDLYGFDIMTKRFKTSYDRRQFIEQHQNLHIVECLKPEQEFLIVAFCKNIFDDDFNTQKKRIFFLDIETEISDHFVGGNEASNRINLITLFDTKTDKYYSWSLKKTTKPESFTKHELYDFFNDNEQNLLLHFVDFVSENYPDVIASWNGQSFDIPYIFRRIEQICGESFAKKLSPFNRYTINSVEKNVDPDKDRSAEVNVRIDGIFEADLLRLYRDKFQIAASLDGGYSLSNVGEHEKLGKKMEYSGSLRGLYERDWDSFYEYNVRDVELLKNIEEKCKLIPLAMRICALGLTDYNAIYTSTQYIIGSLMVFARNKNLIFNSYQNSSDKKQSANTFEGAFVFPIKPGLYKNGISCIDVNSLYPSCIRILNISPETYVGKISLNANVSNHDQPLDVRNDTTHDEFWLKMSDGKTQKIKKEKLLKLIDVNEGKCIYTQNNTLFLKHEIKHGLIAQWADFYYKKRKDLKKQIMEYKLHNPKNLDAQSLEQFIHILDTQQYAIKIELNSVFGLIGASFWNPIANLEIAQSITRQGKFCNISASEYIRNVFEKNFNIDKDYVSTINGDTDSQFLNIECITNYIRNKNKELISIPLDKWADDRKLQLWNFIDTFINEKVNPYIRNLLFQVSGSQHSDIFNYSLEYIASTGIYEQKKRYICRKIVTEGAILTNAIKTTGLELKRTSLPVKIKDILWIIYTKTLDGWTNADFNQFITENFDKFCKLSPNEVSIWKGWNSNNKHMSGFLQHEIGMSSVAYACNAFNQVTKQLNLRKKYAELRPGNKYKFTYLKPNQYNLQYIAFEPDNYPEEFKTIFEIDYETMFEKTIKNALGSFLNATKFSFKDPRKIESYSIDLL